MEKCWCGMRVTHRPQMAQHKGCGKEDQTCVWLVLPRHKRGACQGRHLWLILIPIISLFISSVVLILFRHSSSPFSALVSWLFSSLVSMNQASHLLLLSCKGKFLMSDK
jgi:hypothetical protein